MTIQELATQLSERGWQQQSSDDCVVLKRNGRILTLFGSPDETIPPGVLRALEKYASSEEGG